MLQILFIWIKHLGFEDKVQEGFQLITDLLASNQFCARCSSCHVLFLNPPDFGQPTFEYFCTEIMLMDQVSKMPGIFFNFFHIRLVSISHRLHSFVFLVLTIIISPHRVGLKRDEL